MKSSFNVIFIFCCILTINSQIIGNVSDELDNKLEYATVVLFEQNSDNQIDGVITNIDGDFKFNNIKDGYYYITASFLGYKTKKISEIKILDNIQIDLGNIRLEIGNNLDEVVVSTQRSTIINKIDRQIYKSEIFKSARGSTVKDVIRQLPSVNINSLGEISVRGSTGFSILLNGTPIQGPMSTILDQLPSNAVESIEFITAPSAKFDPDGKAGLINILTKKGAIQGAYGQINLKSGFPSVEKYGNDKVHNRFGSDLTYNIKNDNWNISLGGSILRNDLGGRREGEVFTIIDNVFNNFPSSGERSFDEINFNGRFTVEYSPSLFDNISVGFFAGKRSKKRLADIVYYDNYRISPVGTNNKTQYISYFNHNLRERKGDFILGNLNYSHTLKNKSILNFSLLYEYTLLGGPTINQNLGHPDNSILFQDEYNTNDNPLYGLRTQLDYSFDLNKNTKLDIGYQYRDLDHTGDFVYQRRYNFNDPFYLVPEFSSEVNLKRKIHSFFSQFSTQKENLSYSAGLRIESMKRNLLLKDKANTIDENLQYNFTKLYPSASVQYILNEVTKLKLAYSKRVERTTTFKMNPFPEREHTETLEQGDPNLKPELIDQIEIGFEKKLKNNNKIFSSLYLRNTKNVVNRVNTVYNDSILNRIYSNVGNSRTIGIEIGADLNKSKKWKSFIGGNIYNYDLNGSFDNRPIKTNSIIYSLNLNSTYTFWDDASLQFTFNYISDRITAQGEDSRYYNPNLTLEKTFLNNRLKIALQWLNIDLGLLKSNEQRITTWRKDEFYTTTNYIYEVDIIMLNLSYIFKNGKNKSKFIESEFGKREF
ncbi:MAG: TonB-dependent receptor [Flavobacteriaceae bacterium]|nr:TonB-dependent receptor [Flavobacteriaceae bacterium]